MVTVQDAVMIGRQEERGYFILQVSGRLDDNVYSRGNEPGPLNTFKKYVSETLDREIAIDVRECRFTGSRSMAFFVEAYKMRRKKIPLISSDQHLAEILKRTQIEDFVDIYKTLDDLPDITSSQSGQTGQEVPQAAR